MQLPRLGRTPFPSASRSRLDDSGFIMVALLVAMAVSAIWLGTMLPAWRQQAIRQREADLVFRGQQYARAIALFYANNNCTLPANVDVLVSRHYLRKKWKDPIANDDFVPLISGMAANPSASPGLTATPPRPGAQAPGGTAQLIGVYGVSSKSTATSIMVYQNQQQYSLWSFRYTDALQLMGRPMSCNNQNPSGPTTGTGRGNGPTQTGPRGTGAGGPIGPGTIGSMPTGPARSGPPPPGLGSPVVRGRGGF